MANWWRITVEQGKYTHWFEVHPYRMNRIEKWIDNMVKKYPEIKFHINQEMAFEVSYLVEWDKKYNLIRLTQTNYEDPTFTYDFQYHSSDIYYYKEFPNKLINIRKLKLDKIKLSYE
jgi:hypothetical protein